MDSAQQTDILKQGLEGLATIVEAVRQHPGTGQGRRLLLFLGGIYNGRDFPFDLTDLRALDTRLAEACLAALALDRLAIPEVHQWGIVDGPTLEGWFQRAGLYYEARARLLGRELYRAKYGEDGHADEDVDQELADAR